MVSLDFDQLILKDSTRPDVPNYPWMAEVTMELVTMETLDRVFEFCLQHKFCAVDLETTGLDTRVFEDRTQAQIVGICLSPDGVHGYYLPIRHEVGSHANLDITRVQPWMRKLTQKVQCIFHNGWFDQEFLEFCGGEPMGEWLLPDGFHDTMLLAYLMDSRSRELGLKHLAKTYAGCEMIELDELFPVDYHGPRNFARLDPTWDACVKYACSDAICTYKLFTIFLPKVLMPEGDMKSGQKSIYMLEKYCMAATRWMQRCRVAIDPKKVQYLVSIGQQEFRDILFEMYEETSKMVGRDIRPGWVLRFFENFVADDPTLDIREQIDIARKQAKRERLDILDAKGKYAHVTTPKGSFPGKYDLLSRDQLGILLGELQVPGLRYTDKSNQVLTRDDEIDRLTGEVGDRYPFLPKISRLAELQKALGTYLLALLKDTAHDGTLSIKFKQLGTDTGRFTTPTPKGERKKSSGGTSYPYHGTPATYDTSKPECLLRIREAFVARPGKVMVAIDFSGVELRIAAAYAHEENWIKEYFRCSTCGTEFPKGDGTSTPEAPPGYCPKCGDDRIGDLHTSTALAFFGEDGPEKYGAKEWKNKRQYGKRSNFLLIYGGSAKGLQAAIPGSTEDDCYRYHRAFSLKNPHIVGWWQAIRDFGRRHGYVKTALGRRYPVKDLQLPVSPREEPNPEEREKNKKLRAKAERNATNGPIQGCSADITKLAMALIHQEVKTRGWFKKVFMVGTIHDELVFEIDLDILPEAIETFERIMCRNPTILKLKWPVPLISDCEIGPNWSVPFNVKDFKYRRVRRDGVQVDAKGNPTKKVWPKEYVEVFGPVYGYAEDGVVTNTPPTPAAPEHPPVPSLKPDPSIHVHVLHPSVSLAKKLAQDLRRCVGDVKVILDIGGVQVPGDLRVNPTVFQPIAADYEKAGTVKVRWPNQS